MKKKAATRNPMSISHSLGPFIEQVRTLVQSARQAAATSVNTLQIITNFEIGRRIVEHEQQGAARAKHEKELLKELSLRLTEELGNEFSEHNLRSFRSFYRTYQEHSHQIWQKPSTKLALEPKSQKPSGQSPFTLSWSHYVLLLTIKHSEECQHPWLPIPTLPAFQKRPETAPHRVDCGDRR